MIRIFIESGVGAAKDKNKETTNEKDFVVKFIEHHFKEMVYKTDFDVFGIGGYTKLINIQPLLEDKTDNDINIVIFDADDAYNGGGYKIRYQELLNVQNQMKVEFDLFLWPNNHDDGDFESLLELMINSEHQGMLDCYDGFEKCVSRRDSKGELYKLPGRKAKMYTYISIMNLSKTERDKLSKGYYLFEDERYWNLDAPAIKPLKDFLKQYCR
jgi:hypothetical protein